MRRICDDYPSQRQEAVLSAAVTVADVLQMPAVRSAQPTILAGAGGVSREVRWVHTTELHDIAPLLRGGDLVLTTGIALPDAPDALAGFAQGLWDSDAAGLLIELGRRWERAPGALVDACERLGLPLVALEREVRFAAVAQAVGERLVDQQVAELREAQRVHETFTELSISEAGPERILQAVQQLAGSAVVLESEQHRVLDYRSGPDDVAGFLDDWERRSRSVALVGRTTWDEGNGWLLTRVGRRERGWGRLVIGVASRPTERLTAVAERAAAALAMHRLHDRQRDGQTRRVHHELLVGLLTDPAHPDLRRRFQLVGLPGDGHRVVGIATRPATNLTPSASTRAAGVGGHHLDDLVAIVLRECEAARIPAVVGVIDDVALMIVSLPAGADPVRKVNDLVRGFGARQAVVAAAGSPTSDLADADHTLREAQQVLAAVSSAGSGLVVHRLEDVHVRGLLTLLGDDERVRSFAQRELAALHEHDDRSGAGLVTTLRTLLQAGGSKSRAAEALHMSRPALYDRVAKIERVLGVDLADAEIATSLHLALLAEEIHRAVGVPARNRRKP